MPIRTGPSRTGPTPSRVTQHSGRTSTWTDTGITKGDSSSDLCPTTYGTSRIDRFGCLDSDNDGYSNPTIGWSTTLGADAQLSPTPPSGWTPDEDGFGDNPLGSDSDECPGVSGQSRNDRRGCPDSDGDGWSDPEENWTVSEGADAIPDLAGQHSDIDMDGYGDNPTGPSADACVTTPGSSMVDRYGCPDMDDDGVSDQNDKFPGDSTRWYDSDNDGFDDLLDDCPTAFGSSTIDRVGCYDQDSDGYSSQDVSWSISDGADALPLSPTQWSDMDQDGYGTTWMGWTRTTARGAPLPVDDRGCSDFQRDTDGDGLSDDRDPCVNQSLNLCFNAVTGSGGKDQVVNTIALYAAISILSAAIVLRTVTRSLSNKSKPNITHGNYRYRREDQLSTRGGMADVWICVREDNGEEFIWKEAKDGGRNNPLIKTNKNLENEKEALESLYENPNFTSEAIPKYEAFGSYRNGMSTVNVLVMEYVKGLNLEEYMEVRKASGRSRGPREDETDLRAARRNGGPV